MPVSHLHLGGAALPAVLTPNTRPVRYGAFIKPVMETIKNGNTVYSELPGPNSRTQKHPKIGRTCTVRYPRKNQPVAYSLARSPFKTVYLALSYTSNPGVDGKLLNDARSCMPNRKRDVLVRSARGQPLRDWLLTPELLWQSRGELSISERVCGSSPHAVRGRLCGLLEEHHLVEDTCRK